MIDSAKADSNGYDFWSVAHVSYSLVLFVAEASDLATDWPVKSDPMGSSTCADQLRRVFTTFVPSRIGPVQCDRWFFRWRENVDGDTVRRAVLVGTKEEFRTKARAMKAAEPFRIAANAGAEPPAPEVITVNAIVSKYIEEKMPQRFSTRSAYMSNLKNYILPK